MKIIFLSLLSVIANAAPKYTAGQCVANWFGPKTVDGVPQRAKISQCIKRVDEQSYLVDIHYHFDIFVDQTVRHQELDEDDGYHLINCSRLDHVLKEGK